MLSELATEKVCFVIVKIREYDVQVDEPIGNASDASDDKFVAVFTDERNASVKQEVEAFIGAMNVDEQNELVALMLVGRGDYGVEEWADALRDATSRPEPSAAAYLLGIPTVSDFLEEGLSLFGLSCEDFETDRL